MLKRYPIYFLRNVSKRIFKVKSSQYSTIAAAKSTENTNFDKTIQDLEALSTIIKKNRIKLPQRPPFAKNIFLGKFDTELLTYPQLKKDEVDELEKISTILQKIYSQQNLPNNIREELDRQKNYKCLGLQCPIELGGRELNVSEQCKFNEIILDNEFKYNLISNQVCIYAILKFGSDDLKDRYLAKLMDGKLLSTLSISDNLPGNNEFATVATRSEGDMYKLNGRKLYVVGAEDADLYIVFAKMSDSVEGSVQELDLTPFIVEKNMPGIKIEKQETKDPSLKGLCNLVFNDTPVPSKNILSSERDGRLVLSTLLPEYHMTSSVVSLNILKKLSKYLAEDAIDKSPPGEHIYDTEAITSRLGEVLTSTYVVESMLYFTSGLQSTYDNQDCELEALITRVYSSELAFKCTQLGFSLSGVSSMTSSHFCQQLHQEAVSHFISYENENMLRILIALLGIQYFGSNVGDTVKKLRNPLFHGNFIFKKIWADRFQHEDRPRLDIGLKNFLHPSCQDAADVIEYCVIRLKYVTEVYFAKYGMELLNQHCHLRRLANAIIQIYAMSACLSRASRSYCIGLPHTDFEVTIARIVCQRGRDIFKENVHEILYGFEMGDKTWKVVTDNLYKERNYYVSHPLSRNF